jgi:hypothetical protein
MSDLNRDLIEQLLQRIDLLEKEMKHHKKKKKMADKDYDKDGKVESSEDEYLGSRDRAIKKAKGEKIEEALDRIGGNVNNNSPSIRSLASKIEKSDLVEKVVNRLDEMNGMNKKSIKDYGTKVQLSENLIFGGFPRTKLNEAQYVIPANSKEQAENEDNPATVGMREMYKLLSGPSHPLMAGQDKGGPRGVPDKIRQEALRHLETLQNHPKGKVEGYGPEHQFYKEAKAAHEFFKTHFPAFGVEEQIASEYNLG